MAHEVKFQVPDEWYVMGGKDLVFEVRGDGELIGELKISQGGVTWRSKGRQKQNSMEWERFDTTMQEHGQES